MNGFDDHATAKHYLSNLRRAEYQRDEERALRIGFQWLSGILLCVLAGMVLTWIRG